MTTPTPAPALETTMELLRDTERSLRNILVTDYGVPRNAIRTWLQELPPGLRLQVDREWLPPVMRRDPSLLDELMIALCKSTRTTLDRLLPSLSHGLGMQYIPEAATVEIGVGPDTQPVYPHIITGKVERLHMTPAGERHLRQRNKYGAL